MPEDRMPCGVGQEELSAWVDGEIEAPRADELQAHVSTCSHCAARVAAFERAGALLSALPERAVPADLRARLQARIEVEPEATPRPAPGRAAPPPRRRWLGTPGLATAAAVAAAVALYWAFAPAESVDPQLEGPTIAQEVPTPAPVVPEAAPVSPAPELEQLVEAPEPTPPPAQPELPTPPREIVAEAPTPQASPTPVPAEVDPLDGVPEEEIAVALELETIEDLDVIANLELLEALVALREGTG